LVILNSSIKMLDANSDEPYGLDCRDPDFNPTRAAGI